MKSNSKIVEVLSDLILINRDRIAGYERASHIEAELDPGAQSAFYKISNDSRSFVNDLHSQILRLGGSPVTQASIPGGLYGYWTSLGADFTGIDPHSMLAALEYGEESVQKAYRQALEAGIWFPDEVQRLLENQLGRLQRLHESGVY
jgi:uncharacterized protein (TIGR02284 family)